MSMANFRFISSWWSRICPASSCLALLSASSKWAMSSRALSWFSSPSLLTSSISLFRESSWREAVERQEDHQLVGWTVCTVYPTVNSARVYLCHPDLPFESIQVPSEPLDVAHRVWDIPLYITHILLTLLYFSDHVVHLRWVIWEESKTWNSTDLYGIFMSSIPLSQNRFLNTRFHILFSITV